MKKELLITKIETLLNATPFGSMELPKAKQFKIKEFDEGDEMIDVVSIETNDAGQSQVVTCDDYVIKLQDMTYRELELVYKSIK